MSVIPDMLRSEYFFDVNLVEYKEIFDDVSYVWEIVRKIQAGEFINRLARSGCQAVSVSELNGFNVNGSFEGRIANGSVIGPGVVVSGAGGVLCVDKGAEIKPGTFINVGTNAVYIGCGARVGPNAHLDAVKGSIYISANVELRQCSYVRECSVISAGAVIGNSCEIKSSFIGLDAEVPHFNYVGDSVLGSKAHLGAGAKISNLKIMPDPEKADTVKIRYEGQTWDTGLRKMGAILGDNVQIGCNAVTNPGSIIGKNVFVYAGSNVSGFIPSNTVVKLRQVFERTGLNPNIA